MSVPQRKRSTLRGGPGANFSLVLTGLGVAVVAVAAAGAIYIANGRERSEGSAITRAAIQNEPETAVSVVSFEPFVVSLADVDRRRLMKVTLRATLSDENLEGQIVADPLLKARVRDRVLAALSSRSFEDVTGPRGKDRLRREVRRELNEFFPGESVDDIVITELVVR